MFSLLLAGLLLVISTRTFAEAGVLYQQQARELKEGGRIIGKVRVKGRLKSPAPVKVYKNRDFCGDKVPNESFLFSSDGDIQNVVITLPGVRRTAETSLKSLFLDNKNCAFVPHVQVAPVGSELLLLNSDPILHDVHARIGSETLFNVGLPTWRRVTKSLTRTGIVTIVCDVLHTWMSAYIVVTSSRYFAVTDEKGEFIIEGVPAGTYDMRIWHEKLGSQSTTVVVMEDRASKVDLVLPCFFC
jgi:hypothetical protein